VLGTMLGLKLERHPRVGGWCKRCAERPAFKKAQ
jgi:glutathione S-transferase